MRPALLPLVKSRFYRAVAQLRPKLKARNGFPSTARQNCGLRLPISTSWSDSCIRSSTLLSNSASSCLPLRWTTYLDITYRMAFRKSGFKQVGAMVC
jgi:hypothetical protein